MATKKINYNEVKQNSENAQLAEAFRMQKNAPVKTVYKKIKVTEIHLDDEFTNLLPYSAQQVQDIAENIKDKGYRQNEPILLAKILEEPSTIEAPIRIDGRHRSEAAALAEIDEVPVIELTFETRKEAVIYVLEKELLHRHLTDGQKVKAVMMLDELKNPGRKSADSTDKASGKSAELIAQKIGMSARNVDKVRNVFNNGDEQTKKALLNGEISINAADDSVNKSKPKNKIPKPRPPQPEAVAENGIITQEQEDITPEVDSFSGDTTSEIETPQIEESSEVESTENEQKDNQPLYSIQQITLVLTQVQLSESVILRIKNLLEDGSVWK